MGEVTGPGPERGCVAERPRGVRSRPKVVCGQCLETALRGAPVVAVDELGELWTGDRGAVRRCGADPFDEVQHLCGGAALAA